MKTTFSEIKLANSGKGRSVALSYEECRTKRIADHTLVALTVMIAESKPREKELMVNIVMTFLK